MSNSDKTRFLHHTHTVQTARQGRVIGRRTAHHPTPAMAGHGRPWPAMADVCVSGEVHHPTSKVILYDFVLDRALLPYVILRFALLELCWGAEKYLVRVPPSTPTLPHPPLLSTPHPPLGPLGPKGPQRSQGGSGRGDRRGGGGRVGVGGDLKLAHPNSSVADGD